jgi:hypothetical protein
MDPQLPQSDASVTAELPATTAGPVITDWWADAILFAGFLACTAIAVGWVDAPLANPTRQAAPARKSSLTSPTQVSEDSRFGIWTSPVDSHRIRTAKLTSSGIYAARVTFSVDYKTSEGIVVPGALGEYSATALLQDGNRGQAVENDHSCVVQFEWVTPEDLKVVQKGPCGEPANVAGEGMFTGSYRKTGPPAQPAIVRPDCTKLRSNEEKLFCSEPALGVAKEVTAAIFSEAATALRGMNPNDGATFDAADGAWQKEIRRVCLAAESSPENPNEGKAACFTQSFDARMNWLRLHTGMIRLAEFAAKTPNAMNRYAEALAGYMDAHGALSLYLPMFTKRLRSILPPKEAEEFEDAMAYRGPRDGLFQSGCGALGCDQHEAAFEITPETGSVTVALRKGPRIFVYSLEGESADLPNGIEQWLEARSTRVREINYRPD